MELTDKDLPQFRRALLHWYNNNKRDLPWRRTRLPYRIWISEIMLQQTRVAAATGYYTRFCSRFPTVRRLARAPVESVLRSWAGLGYYSRARNLHQAAKLIVTLHRGRFPRSMEDALALPGIGRYTAAAVLSIAGGQPVAVLDGNVARVLARLSAIRGDLRQAKVWRRLHHMTDRLLHRGHPGDWNQALMELGATLCTPRLPRCSECPVRQWCRARTMGIADRLPAARKKASPVRITIAAAVLLDPRGRTLVIRPRDGVLFSRLWQFPAVQATDAAHELSSHLARRYGLRQPLLEPLGTARHAVTYRNIRLAPFLVRLNTLPRVEGARMPHLSEITRLPISNATRKISLAALASLVRAVSLPLSRLRSPVKMNQC